MLVLRTGNRVPSPGDVDVEGYSFFSLYTILFILGGVAMDFRASSFGFHTNLFFFGGVGTTFGVFSFVTFGAPQQNTPLVWERLH
jgi:hypothetical protein